MKQELKEIQKFVEEAVRIDSAEFCEFIGLEQVLCVLPIEFTDMECQIIKNNNKPFINFYHPLIDFRNFEWKLGMSFEEQSESTRIKIAKMLGYKLKAERPTCECEFNEICDKCVPF